MRISYIADHRKPAQKLLAHLQQIFDIKDINEAIDPEVILVIGGDGTMLRAMHQYMHLNIPFYGINAGNIGFLLNNNLEDNLIEHLRNSHEAILHPLQMEATDHDGKEHKALAINEVYINRVSNQAAKIRISLDGVVRMAELSADGALVSTPAGSSAYNLSAGGSIIPLGSNTLALTPICPFRPRRWRGALIPHTSEVVFDIMNPEHRIVNACADFLEFNNIVKVRIKEKRDISIKLLFNKEHSWQHRILTEQFES